MNFGEKKDFEELLSIIDTKLEKYCMSHFSQYEPKNKIDQVVWTITYFFQNFLWKGGNLIIGPKPENRLDDRKSQFDSALANLLPKEFKEKLEIINEFIKERVKEEKIINFIIEKVPLDSLDINIKNSALVNYYLMLKKTCIQCLNEPKAAAGFNCNKCNYFDKLKSKILSKYSSKMLNILFEVFDSIPHFKVIWKTKYMAYSLETNPEDN